MKSKNKAHLNGRRAKRCGWTGGGVARYVLVDDHVWREAQHVAVALLVRPPAQAETHEEEPRALQQGHLVVQVQVPET